MTNQQTLSPGEKDALFHPFFLRLPPRNIALFKFLLESYEGLGIVRTLNRHSGEIAVLALADTAGVIRALLETLRSETDFEILPTPQSINEDWLLADLPEARR
jgi:hypothetical protein